MKDAPKFLPHRLGYKPLAHLATWRLDRFPRSAFGAAEGFVSVGYLGTSGKIAPQSTKLSVVSARKFDCEVWRSF